MSRQIVPAGAAITCPKLGEGVVIDADAWSARIEWAGLPEGGRRLIHTATDLRRMTWKTPPRTERGRHTEKSRLAERIRRGRQSMSDRCTRLLGLYDQMTAAERNSARSELTWLEKKWNLWLQREER
jgi:hypothetical protein